MVEYLSGGRIQGSSTDTTPLTIPNTSWKELGRTTWSSGDTLDVTNFAEKDNLMVLAFCTTNSDNQHFQVGYNGTISEEDYTFRGHRKAEADRTTGVPSGESADWGMMSLDSHANGQEFYIINIRNKSTHNKGITSMGFEGAAAGSGESANIGNHDFVGYHYKDDAQIDSVRFTSNSGSHTVQSQAVVLGCDDDEADSGTNFWQELGSATLTSDTAYIEIDDDALKKKWLYIQYYRPDCSNGVEHLTFNGDTDTNYQHCGWNNSASFVSSNNRSNILPNGDASSTVPAFVDAYIFNDTVHEKLFNGYGNRDAYINRVCGKYDPSSLSTQISSIRFTASSGTLGDGTTLKVWGAD